MSFTDRMYQDEVWPTRDSRNLLIAAMSIEHVYNSLAYLEKNAERIALSYAMSPVFLAAPDDVHAELDRIVEDPKTWVRSTPVYRALLKRAKQVRKGR